MASETGALHAAAWQRIKLSVPQPVLARVIRHEALLNLAFADGRVRLLCPYSLGLGAEVVAGVQRTHPVMVRDRRVQHSIPCGSTGLIPDEHRAH
jgi:hypothetical protein